MMVSPKWEKQGSDLQSHLNKIVNIPLPSQQATKILKDLQTSCSSPNKATQLKSLQCWKAWIIGQSLEEWESDSMCHFAMKPLLAKKTHPLHKDSDLCKLKLNIMWTLLASVQMKVDMNGPKYILENFLQSCFTWLTSVEQLENEVSVLILKLILALFQKKKEDITNSLYVFNSVQIDEATLEKQFHSVIEKFLDVFNNWKKFHNNELLIELWKWFLECCECFHDSVATTIWHRIFKVNQTFCSEKSEPIKDKLSVLHTCATKVKTVLSSSKYIGGENCFMTPCEALLKKLSEISKIEELPELSSNDKTELFQMSQETCQTLSCKSIEIRDYDLCIQFLDSLEDFSLKSLFWGSWSGLAECFEKFLLPRNRIDYTKTQMKFYRKLRAPVINFELDKVYLNENSLTTVYKNIGILNISCFCQDEILNSTFCDKTSRFTEVKNSSTRPETESHSSKNDVPLTANINNETMLPVSYNSNFPSAVDSIGRTLKITIDAGKFGHLNGVHVDDVRVKPLKIIHLDLDVVKNVLGGIPLMDRIRFQSFHFDFIRLAKSETVASKKYLCPPSNSSNIVMNEKEPEPEPGKRKISEVPIETTPKRASKKRSQSSLAFTADETVDEGSMTPRTRSRRKLEMEMKAKAAESGEKVPTPKKHKSFEEVVQEIFEKNRLRKSRKSMGEIENSDAKPSPQRELRSRRKTMSPEKNRDNNKRVKKTPTRTGKSETPQRTPSKGEEKSGKNDGTLENFFKVINNPNNDCKENKSLSGSKKCDTPRAKKGRKGKKGLDNWKQTSLEKMMKENEVKTEKPEEPKENKKIENKIPQMLKSSPFKEVRHDHEYAKINDSVPVLSENHNSLKSSHKKLKKSQELTSVNESEIENVDPETREKGSKRHIIQTFEEPMEIDEEISLSETKNEEEFSITEPLGDSKAEGISVTDSKGTEEAEVRVEMEKKEENIAEVGDSSNIEVSILPKVNNLIETLPQTDENTTNLKIDDVKTMSGTELKNEDENEIKNGCTEEERVEFKGRKRFFPSLECDDGETKRLKLESDGVAPLIETPFDGENSENPTSPLKTNEKPETNSPKGKTNLNSPRIKKMANRVIPTRISRMIALIPDSDLKEGQQAKGESPNQPQHFLNGSPKMESKDRNRKFTGADRSSRVSKMLASLSMSKGKDFEEPNEDEKRIFEGTEGSTPNGNASAAKLTSPKSSKKRKFIGFDETKNQTVIYRTDTPPSQVLREWELIKEEYLNFQEIGPEDEAETEEDLLVSTPPPRFWQPRKKSRFCLMETDSLVFDAPDD